MTRRKLIPALYHLYLEGQLPEPFRIIGFSRREKTDEIWRQELWQSLRNSRAHSPWVVKLERFAGCISYQRGDITQDNDFKRLKQRVYAAEHPVLAHQLLFYLAISPSQFMHTVSALSRVGLLRHQTREHGWQRVVVEKPFGHDGPSAQSLNDSLISFAHEKQIYRIDHYLGKETVQNILAFLFPMPFLKPHGTAGLLTIFKSP